MAELRNLRELLIDRLKELYDGKKQLSARLPEFREECTDTGLENKLKKYEDFTAEHTSRLESALLILNEEPIADQSESMAKMLWKTGDLVTHSLDPQILDASLVISIQQIIHYQIAGYGGVCAFAKELGLDKITGMLYPSLKEEKEIDQEFTLLAVENLNIKAISQVLK